MKKRLGNRELLPVLALAIFVFSVIAFSSSTQGTNTDFSRLIHGALGSITGSDIGIVDESQPPSVASLEISAQPETHIEEDPLGIQAVNISSCSMSLTANTAYQLNRSLNSTGRCLTIAANNITFDCNGFNITGNGTEDGIIIDSVSHNIRGKGAQAE